MVRVPEPIERQANRKRRGPSGSGHEGHQHFIALELVASVDNNRVRLSANGDVAVMFEEEQDNSPIH